MAEGWPVALHRLAAEFQVPSVIDWSSSGFRHWERVARRARGDAARVTASWNGPPRVTGFPPSASIIAPWVKLLVHTGPVGVRTDTPEPAAGSVPRIRLQRRSL